MRHLAGGEGVRGVGGTRGRKGERSRNLRYHEAMCNKIDNYFTPKQNNMNFFNEICIIKQEIESLFRCCKISSQCTKNEVFH